MIVGVGVDIIEKDRVLKAYGKESFKVRYYTKAEQAEIAVSNHKAASDFAVKEAVAKAFGTGFSKIMPEQIEVLRKDSGKPYVNLYGAAKELADELGVVNIHVSISDTDTLVNAYVICEK